LGLLAKRAPGASLIERMHVEGRSLLNRTSDGGIRFAHQSILEFFVAKHLCRQRTSKRDDMFKPNSDQLKLFISDLIAHRSLADCDDLDLSGIRLHNIKLKSGAAFVRANLGNAVLFGCGFQRLASPVQIWMAPLSKIVISLRRT